MTNERESTAQRVTPAWQERSLIVRPVGKFGTNSEHDIKAVERLLGDVGVLDPVRASEPTGRLDSDLTAAIHAFQEMKGLKADGFMAPSGPTMRALNAMAGASNKQRTQAGGQEPRVEPEMVAANARLVSALRSSTDLGPLPSYIAEAANNGDTGRAEVIDLFRQIRATAPDVSPRLHKALQPLIDARQHRALYAEAAVPPDSEEKPSPKPENPNGDDPNKPDNPGRPEKPDDPGKPDEPDRPNDPDKPREPEPPDDPDDPDNGDDEDKQKRCAELAFLYRQAVAEFEANQESWKKADKKYEELLESAKTDQEKLEDECLKFAAEMVVPVAKVYRALKAGQRIVKVIRNGGMADLSLSLDVVDAWNRVRDSDDLQKQQLAIRDDFEAQMQESREKMRSLRAEMRALGCSQAKS